MFSTLTPYGRADRIYHADSIHAVDLETLVEHALADPGRLAPRIARDLAWTTRLAPVVAAWEAR
jgi:hypothetical protein